MTTKKSRGDVIYHWPITEKDYKVDPKTGFCRIVCVDVSPSLSKYGVPTTKFLFSKRKPIAYSSTATYEWLEILSRECSSWEDMLGKVSGQTGEYLRDEEGYETVFKLLNSGVPFQGYFKQT